MMLEDDSRIASRRARSASAPRLTAHALTGHAQSLRRGGEPHAAPDRCGHAGALLDDLAGVEHEVLAEARTDELDADRQAAVHAGGHREPGHAEDGQRHARP